MVKRTAVVLGILALITMGAGMTSAQAMGLGGPVGPQSWVTGFPGGGCGSSLPLYVPVPCPEYPLSRTIVKTWSCKIEGPCPPPGPPSGCCGGSGAGICGSLCYLATSLATPFDWLFGGTDGVYGCFPGGICGSGGPCGPCYGPVPGIIASAMGALSPPSVMFGCYW